MGRLMKQQPKSRAKAAAPIGVQIEYVAPGALNPAPYNPRKITEERLGRLAKLLDAHGFVDPIIARREDGLVIGGHQRLRANELREKPDAQVPVVFLDGQTDEKVREIYELLKYNAQIRWKESYKKVLGLALAHSVGMDI